MRIFSGNANRPLAQAIADAVGIPLGAMNCNRFPDGEVKVQVMEDVRGADVFVVQSTTTNDFLMELLVMTDALRRASASRGSTMRHDKCRPRAVVPTTSPQSAIAVRTSGTTREFSSTSSAPAAMTVASVAGNRSGATR